MTPAANHWATRYIDSSSSPACPACGAHSLNRVQRRFVDRLLSLFGRVRRYRCYAFNCQWEGNLNVANHESE
ncbi:MAG: hypothetical protein ACOYB3_07350 [Azonexus sp.]